MKTAVFCAIFTLLIACKPDSVLDDTCQNITQNEIPVLKFVVIDSKTQKNVFANGDSSFVKDSLKVYVQRGFEVKLDTIALAKDTIKTQNWIAMSQILPSSNYLYLRYSAKKYDTLFIDYQSQKLSCNFIYYENYQINNVLKNNINLIFNSTTNSYINTR
jgi:hypothetical protein